MPLEDGGRREALDHITREFGHAVAAIVRDNSDMIDQAPEGGSGREWYVRKRAYVDAFAEKSPAALRVSLADKLHNSRSILIDYRTHGDALWARFRQGQGIATRIYYRELAGAFEREQHRIGPAAQPYVDELRRTVDAITALAEEHQGADSRAGFAG